MEEKGEKAKWKSLPETGNRKVEARIQKKR